MFYKNFKKIRKNYTYTTIIPFETEMMRIAVRCVVEHVCEYVTLAAERTTRTPNHLEALRFVSNLVILIVDTSKEERIHAHRGKQCCLLTRMTKLNKQLVHTTHFQAPTNKKTNRINMPSDRWSNTEFSHQELMTQCQLFDRRFIMSTSLIIHTPLKNENKTKQNLNEISQCFSVFVLFLCFCTSHH